MLQNLYLLHDPSFDEELRRAAIYITDRRVIFQMIEAAHYRLHTIKGEGDQTAQQASTPHEREKRTISLINNFLDSIPQQDAEGKKSSANTSVRKPTPADAAVDYVAYLLESETEEDTSEATPQLIGQNLIDSFINSDKSKIVLSDNPQFVPQQEGTDGDSQKDAEEVFFTETLARIYIKQGRYSKALEIIRQLNLQYPKKNAYFADQIRFLEKLIINNNKKQ